MENLGAEKVGNRLYGKFNADCLFDKDFYRKNEDVVDYYFSDYEYDILFLRFCSGKTEESIGSLLGKTQETITIVKRQLIKKMSMGVWNKLNMKTICNEILKLDKFIDKMLKKGDYKPTFECKRLKYLWQVLSNKGLVSHSTKASLLRYYGDFTNTTTIIKNNVIIAHQKRKEEGLGCSVQDQNIMRQFIINSCFKRHLVKYCQPS